MIHDVMTLISAELTKDALGVISRTETEREVFCEVSSVSASEWYEASRADLNPEYKFRLFFADYQGEKACRYQGNTYAIYRTYRDGDYMELYAERKVGA